MMLKSVTVIFLICLGISASSQRCEPITSPLCQGLGYNQTTFPNILGHKNQANADIEVHTYSPLVKIDCSPSLKVFLCSLYLPVCTILTEPVLPCREVCESSRDGCSELMRKFGYEWPAHMNCNRFPSAASGSLCVSDPMSTTASPALNETTTASPPQIVSDQQLSQGKRVDFVVRYRVNCSAFNRDNSMKVVARKVAQANINHLLEVCSKVCQVNRNLRMKCQGDTLTVTYPTSLEYPLATKSINRKVKKALMRNIRRKRTMLLMVLPGHTPVAQFPLEGERDYPMSVELHRYC